MDVKVVFDRCRHTRIVSGITEGNMAEKLSPLFRTRTGWCVRCNSIRYISRFFVDRTDEQTTYAMSDFVYSHVPVLNPIALGLPVVDYVYQCCGYTVTGVRPSRSAWRIMGSNPYGTCPECGSYTDVSIGAPSSNRRVVAGDGYSPEACAVTLGCDPEFEIPGTRDASSFLRRHGENGDLYHLPIGADGAGD